MNPMTDVRERLAAVLKAADLVVTVHTYRPGSVNGPCVVVDAPAPGEPWITPRGHVSYWVYVYAAATTTQSATQRLEQLAWDVCEALARCGTSWGNFNAPEYDSTAQLAFCSISTTTRP
jgi:hypothetical protein